MFLLLQFLPLVKNYEELFDKLVARGQIYLEVSTGITGDEYYYGQVYVTSVEKSAPMEDNVTFSASFEGTGQLQKGVN